MSGDRTSAPCPAPPVRHPILQAAEEQLTASIAKADASPFLAHHDLRDGVDPLPDLRALIDGRAERVSHAFSLSPLVTIWAIAQAIARGYQSEDDNAVYPLIERALGLDHLPQKSQREIQQALRRACRRRGLATAIEGYARDIWVAHPIDDFFMQAGVPLLQADKLASIFRKAEAAWGSPPVESSEALSRWEDEAVREFAPPGIRRMPKVLLFDETSYHAALYARLCEGALPQDDFQRAFASAIEAMPQLEVPREPRPVVKYEEGTLVVRDGRSSKGFILQLGKRRQRIDRHTVARVPMPWPEALEWRTLDSPSSKTLPVMPASERFVVFEARTGSCVHRHDANGRDVLRLPLGALVFLSRRPFSIDGTESIESEAGCHELWHDLRQEGAFVDAAGRVTLHVERRATLRFVEATEVGRSGGYPWMLGIGTLEATHPALADAPPAAFELRLTHPSLGPEGVTVPLPRAHGWAEVGDAAEQRSTDVGKLLPRTGPFGLLRVELRRAGEQRALRQGAAWYWPGLRAREEGAFLATQRPDNLDHHRSTHVSIQEHGGEWRLELDDPWKVAFTHARLVFNATASDATERERAGGRGRPAVTAAGGDDAPLAEFRLRPRGVTLALVSPDGSEQSLRLGHELALAPEDQRVLEVQSTAPHGDIQLGARTLTQPFSAQGILRLKASHLATLGASEALAYRASNRAPWQCLLTVRPLAAPRDFRILRSDAGRLGFAASFGEPVHAVRIRLEGILRGSEERHALDATDDDMRVSEDRRQIEATWPMPPRLPSDLYLAWPEVAFAPGEWRALTNRRHDRYAWSAWCDVALGTVEVPVDVTGDMAAFARLDRLVNTVFERGCWATIEEPLLRLWQQVGLRLGDEGTEGRRALIDAATRRWPSDDTPTWVPLHHPVEFAPDLFGSSVIAFGGADDVGASDGMEELAVLARIEPGADPLAAIDSTNVDYVVVGGFANAAAASRDPRGTPLRGFSFTQYARALEAIPDDDRMSLWTSRQRRLTAMHHDWCCERVVTRMRVVDVEGHNEERRTFVERLGSAAHGAIRSVWQETPLSLAPSTRRTEGWPPLIHVVALISAFARASRGGTVDPLVSALVREAPQLMRRDVRQTLGYLIRLAPELFAFYLLLWEIAERGTDRPPASST